MRACHLLKERISSLGQDAELESLEWRSRCFTTYPSKEKEVKTAGDKDKAKESSEKKPTPPKEPTTTEPKDLGLKKTHPPGFDLKTTTTLSADTRDPKEIPPPSTETLAFVYLVTSTPLSSKVLEHEISEEVIPLSEYKFDRSKFFVIKRTPKQKRTLVGDAERALIEGYEESTLWDISGQDIARIGVESSVVIEGMAMAGQSSPEAMAK
jgi:hypothetical protein